MYTVPCLSKSDCNECTKSVSCVWVSGFHEDNTTDTSVTVSRGESEILYVKSVSHCWDGNPLFVTPRSKDAEDANGVSTTVEVKAGIRDHLWKQCQISQLTINIVALVIIVAAVICLMCCLLLVCCCVVRCMCRG